MSFALGGAVICVNSNIAEFFQQIGVKSEKIHVISPFAFKNGLTDDPLPEPIASFIKEKKPILCNIGLLEPGYDLKLLLRVFHRVVQKNPKAGLVMIGSGSLRTTLENKISELGLQGKASLTGDLPHSDTLRILASSDCYIRVSLYDGDSISLKEAIYLGVPVIATDTGFRPKEAILVPIGDEKGLLTRIMETISAPPRQRKTSAPTELACMVKLERKLSQLR
jgi:glycosyltransferase involved in cell wall biosynthesis